MSEAGFRGLIPPEYASWFQGLTGFPPHPWQRALGASAECQDRLLRIPTGFGKTAGVVLSWLYHRLVRADLRWPTRLVFTLPMRVLVEQTEEAIRKWLEKIGRVNEVGVHVLMGGANAGPWAIAPHRPAILIGTQDMILSRALNRGYGAARGRWPLELGLLHHDVLWVLDEIQLMDVGLATSTQLAAFRRSSAKAHGASLRPAFSWWMSATLQPDWLGTVDFKPALAELSQSTLRIPPEQRTGKLWEVKKSLRREPSICEASALADTVLQGHEPGALTLVILNTVKRAVKLHAEIDKKLSSGKRKTDGASAKTPELRLIHSQFRGAERAAWRRDFLSRDALPPAGGRIIVSTQVVEAGVDISADVLVTELAPWPSLIQRFGRAARYEGRTGQVCVVGPAPEKEVDALPYAPQELAAADEALSALVDGAADVSPRTLEQLEEELLQKSPELLRRLYPYRPEHVLRQGDFLELFDTTPDLTGADLDVSRYIRGGEERDVTVFWRKLSPGDDKRIDSEAVGQVRREELCPVPLQELRGWLKEGHAAYRLDYLEGKWSRLWDWGRLTPGTTLLVPSEEGGYDPASGWSPKHKEPVPPVPEQTTRQPAQTEDAGEEALTQTSAADEADTLSKVPKGWKSIAVHGREAAVEARQIAEALGMDGKLRHLLDLAARWHDVGKGHDVFQRAIKEEARTEAGEEALARDLAKAPEEAWKHPPYPERPGFRHELASTLALFELLRRTRPDHPALLGELTPVLEAMRETPVAVDEAERISNDDPLARELAALSAPEFNLVAWLVCTHHGKVRCGWTSTPKDQGAGEDAIFGVKDKDVLPALKVAGPGGEDAGLPELRLSLACAEMGLNPRYGASWRERVASLLSEYGPFKLAYLEALLRAADVRASKLGEEVAR